MRIFLGAAPGVGKTYEMLTQGRRRRLEGVDVVIGVVETHGRAETEALTKGFEIVPKKRGLYKGRVVAEMDLDAILQRKPGLVLVDELAHTNIEGSRHPKRYLDVEELLAAGIDVFTTVNIQHIESLNDIIAQITRVRVRETVPDAVLDEADDIELVDLTADDLLQRLKEGKVYVKAQAERALSHFFSPGNLTALRELALRKAAQHVDRDMVDYMQAHAIGGPWPAGERILACISEHPSSAELVRRARRLADALHAEWTALYIESPRHATLSEAEKDRVADTLRLASGWAARRPRCRAADRRRHPRLCPQEQCHPDRHRQIRTLARVRNIARFGGARPDPRQRRHQRHRRVAARHDDSGQKRRDRAASLRHRLAGLFVERRRGRGDRRCRAADESLVRPGAGQPGDGVPGSGAGQRGVLRPPHRLHHRLAQRDGL